MFDKKNSSKSFKDVKLTKEVINLFKHSLKKRNTTVLDFYKALNEDNTE